MLDFSVKKRLNDAVQELKTQWKLNHFGVALEVAQVLVGPLTGLKSQASHEIMCQRPIVIKEGLTED